MNTLYPSVRHYLDALSTPRKALRTLGKRVTVAFDSWGDPICRVSRSSLRVLATLDGAQCAIRLSLRALPRTACGDRYEGELRVGAEYFDLWIEEPWPLRPSVEEPEVVAVRDYSEGLYAQEQDGRWGFFDAAGRVVVCPQYDRVEPFCEGRAVVEPFCEGRAVVELDGRCGLIDTQGHLVVPAQYDELNYDGSHYCYVDVDGYSGVVDRTGRVVVVPEWDWVAEFAQGLLLVERHAKYGYLDTTGAVVIEPIYDDASSFDGNGYAWVVKEGRSYSIDKDQNRV